MEEYRVTKYDPALRGPNGEFQGDDWISFNQIGKSFHGIVLTAQEYKRVEDAYIKVALAFLSEGGIKALKVAGLENARQHPLAFGEESVLTLEQLPDVIEPILREDFWCRLEAENGFLHFGWDYYMYIGVPRPCRGAEQIASELGLYVEEFVSPCHEDAAS